MPASPHLITLSTCQLSISACSSWLCRIVSIPNSPRMSGRSSVEILQTEEITLEIALLMQVNVKAKKSTFCGSRNSVGG